MQELRQWWTMLERNLVVIAKMHNALCAHLKTEVGAECDTFKLTVSPVEKSEQAGEIAKAIHTAETATST